MLAFRYVRVVRCITILARAWRWPILRLHRLVPVSSPMARCARSLRPWECRTWWKSTGSSNPRNMIKATFEALKNVRSLRAVAAARRSRRFWPRRRSRRCQGLRTEISYGGNEEEGGQVDGYGHGPAVRSAARDQEQTLVGLGLNKMHRTRTRRYPACADDRKGLFVRVEDAS